MLVMHIRTKQHITSSCQKHYRHDKTAYIGHCQLETIT